MDDLHVLERLVAEEFKERPDPTELHSVSNNPLNLVERVDEGQGGPALGAGRGRLGRVRLSVHSDRVDLGAEEEVDRRVEREAAE